jgi:hypothetical protein
MKVLVVLLASLIFPAQSQEARQVPTSLFGIELGQSYEFPAVSAGDNAVGTFPVKRLVSEQRSLHRGLSVYFEPLGEAEGFPYHEIAQEHGDYPIASYRVRVYPVIPRDVTTLAALRELNLPQQVSLVEWSLGNSETSGDDGYAWARELCKSMEADLGLEPRITDMAEKDVYACVFSSGERELAVTSVVGRTLQLSFIDEITDRMDADVHSRIRRLEIEEARAKRTARPK